jgi:hypothetical protein
VNFLACVKADPEQLLLDSALEADSKSSSQLAVKNEKAALALDYCRISPLSLRRFNSFALWMVRH